MIGNIGLNKGVARIILNFAKIQKTARVREFVNYNYAPISLAKHKANEVGADEPGATCYKYSQHFRPE